jgi:hypothetical protein
MVTIDSKNVVFSTSFMVGNDQEALIDVDIQGEILKLGITFTSATTAEDRNGAWHQENGVVRFTFAGWNNPLGTCVLEPTKFGDIAGKRIYFQLAHHFVGEQNLAHLFILVGG